MPLRIVQVGMGAFGRSWAADKIPQVEDVELVGCVDVAPVSLEKAREIIGLPPDRYFLSLDDALAVTDADAVLIATSLAGHIPATMTALAAGKHVLVEKPFAPTLAEAQLAVDTAAERGLILMVSQNYRFFPGVHAVRDLVARGDFGPLNSVYIDFRRYDNSAPYGSHPHYHFPQPILVDMAIHHFDLMRMILQRPPREIHCRSWNPPWSKFDDPAEAVATIMFDDDLVVSYRGTWLSPGTPTPWAGLWRMEFAEAEVAWTSRSANGPTDIDVVSVRRLGQRARRMKLVPFDYLDRAGSLSAFVHAVRSGEEPETSGRDNIQTLALTLAALEAAASGQPVQL